MAATLGDILDAQIRPEWIEAAVDVIAEFPASASPIERLRILFQRLSQMIGITDGPTLGAIHSRIAALGELDRTADLAALKGSQTSAAAMRFAVATTPLRVDGSHLVFTRGEFEAKLARVRLCSH